MNLFWVSLLFCSFYWILESIRDVITYDKGTLFEQLFHPAPTTSWMRLLTIFIIILCSTKSQSYIEKIKKNKKVRIGFDYKKGILYSGFGFVVLYWILESLRDVFVFQKGNMFTQIFTPDPQDFWIRLLPICIIILFFIHANFVISEFKKEKLENEKLLRQKDLFLREIHHRVKNNLQIITSLLSLQSRYIKDKKTLELFNESKNRIRTISNVYSMLSISNDIKHIDFGDYIKNLIRNIYNSSDEMSQNIRFNLKVSNIPISVDLAVPCGLIINELVSNSLKYAFPSDWKDPQEITIALFKKQNTIELNIKDNGTGLPDKFDIKNLKSLGLTIVTTLVKNQLNGCLDINGKKGVKYTIKFDMNHSKVQN